MMLFVCALLRVRVCVFVWLLVCVGVLLFSLLSVVWRQFVHMIPMVVVSDATVGSP